MIYDASTLNEYLEMIPIERKETIIKLIEVIRNNLPDGFDELYANSFIQFVVPHTVYPDGYHCNPKEPLPFIGIASQKNFIALYHMGIYAFEEILDWFVSEYSNYSKAKLDMGKSCIRFKKMDQIPFELIGELCKKITVSMWIKKYEQEMKKK